MSPEDTQQDPSVEAEEARQHQFRKPGRQWFVLPEDAVKPTPQRAQPPIVGLHFAARPGMHATAHVLVGELSPAP